MICVKCLMSNIVFVYSKRNSRLIIEFTYMSGLGLFLKFLCNFFSDFERIKSEKN